MILAQNHQLPSNGNRILVILAFLCIFISYSCGSSKVASDRGRSTTSTPSKPVIKKPSKKRQPKVDTVDWVVKDDSKAIPEGEIHTTPSLNKDSYNVTVLIPFDAKKYRTSSVTDSRVATRFSNYYAGLLLGLKDLEKQGVRLNVNVLDSKDMSIRAQLNLSSTQNADVIIGPYDRDELKKVIKFGKEKNILVVSPWQAISDPADAHENYVQLRPNLEDYYLKLLTEAKKNFSLDQIRILVREGNTTDNKRVASLQELAKTNGVLENNKSFKILELNTDSLMMGESAYDSIFYSMDRSAYILPNWSSKDENFIYSSLRRMGVEKGMSKVSVYGMELILDSDQIDFEFFKNLDINVVRWKYVDDQKPEVKSFKRQFFSQYNTLPTIDAYDGYDMISYVGQNLKSHGKFFQYKASSTHQYLQTDFDLQPVQSESSEFGSTSKINHFSNKHLDVIRFDGGKFSKK